MKKGLLPVVFLTTALWFANNDNAHAQTNAGAFNDVSSGKAKREELIMLKAGNRSKDADLATVFVTKGPDNMDQFNAFMDAVVKKMASKGVPIEFFVEPVERKGAGFAYFIEYELHGPFNFQEFVALLTEIVRDYKAEYPARTYGLPE